MSKPFDATLNSLIDAHLDDWACFLAGKVEIPFGRASALDTDLSRTLQADRLFRIETDPPTALHLELESTSRLGIPDELHRYSVNARDATGLPVHSVLVLLRPKANASDQTGELIVSDHGRLIAKFYYTVVRIWQESVSDLLAAGPGIAPLALLTNEASHDLPQAFSRFQARLREDDLPSNVERSLLSSTFVLCGLRYEAERIEELYRNLSMTLEDSTTYQLILNRGVSVGRTEGRTEGQVEGSLQEARAMVLRLGKKRFGPPPADIEARILANADREHLERIAEAVFESTDWLTYLSTP